MAFLVVLLLLALLIYCPNACAISLCGLGKHLRMESTPLDTCLGLGLAIALSTQLMAIQFLFTGGVGTVDIR